mmetsp:Transcript_39137/g.103914  ORF Transcript_39137/g.103914 Transcript_39137/m.103914 type:complete len:228 (+) Transcript_39137:352-1035(+)
MCLDPGRQGSRICVPEVDTAFPHTVHHGQLSLSQPLSRVVMTLVGLVSTVRVSNLCLKVPLLLLVEILDSLPICPLGVSVHVHFHNASAQSGHDVVLLRTRSAVEYEEERIFSTNLLGRVFLEGFQQLRLQLHVSSLVHTVDVAEGCSNGELFRDWRQSLPNLVHIFGCRVQLLLAHATVVHTVLRTARDANLHLQNKVQWLHALQIRGTDLNVLLIRLLREVQHVR